MLLAVDVGNSNITFGVFDKEELKVKFRLTTKNARTSDEYGQEVLGILNAQGVRVDEIDDVMIASVVPGVMHSLCNGIIKYIKREPMVVGVGTKTGIRLAVVNPAEVGADRVVDAVAGISLFGGPVLVIDFGTATTYDLVTEDGSFVAAITSPGIRICADALWTQTAKLPEIEIKKPDSILARDTVTSMQAGLVYGYIGQVEYIVKKVKEESGISNMKVIATGGLGRIICGSTDVIDEYDPDLTLKGIMLTYEKSRK
ncbi:MAG: type III pantothenate kinase [Lachnospiraceae bacterium]|nr:type III pantothenate kinase [Lachnospiraceae bacterium]